MSQVLEAAQLNVRSLEVFDKAKDVVIHSESTFRKAEELLKEIQGLQTSLDALDQAKKNDARRASIYLANAGNFLADKIVGWKDAMKLEADKVADLERRREEKSKLIKKHGTYLKEREEARARAEAAGKTTSVFKQK